MRQPTEWGRNDRARAEDFYASLHGTTKLFFDLLMEHPGKRIDVDQITAYFAEHGPKGYVPVRLSVPAALAPVWRKCRALGRPLPYDHWPGPRGAASFYALKPTVPRLLRDARMKIDPSYAGNTRRTNWSRAEVGATVADDAKERSHLPEGMRLVQLTSTPNQSYNVLLGDTLVGTSEHQESWRGKKFWLFTDLEGAQKWVSEGRHHEDGTSWLKAMYQGEAETGASPASPGAGYQANPKRRKAVENHAVKEIMARFTEMIPGCQPKNVGDDKPGYDIEVTCPDGKIWHIEAKGTEGDCGTIDITEGERSHNQESACPHKHALCVVSQITAQPVGEEFECSGGIQNWVSPWKIAEKVSFEPTLKPVNYKYTVPTPTQAAPIPAAADAFE